MYQGKILLSKGKQLILREGWSKGKQLTEGGVEQRQDSMQRLFTDTEKPRKKRKPHSLTKAEEST